jgi:hypothetical protein
MHTNIYKQLEVLDTYRITMKFNYCTMKSNCFSNQLETSAALTLNNNGIRHFHSTHINFVSASEWHHMTLQNTWHQRLHNVSWSVGTVIKYIGRTCFSVYKIMTDLFHSFIYRNVSFYKHILINLLGQSRSEQGCRSCVLLTVTLHRRNYKLNRSIYIFKISWKQNVLGRTNHLLSFHYVLNIRYDMDHIENTASNSSSIVACAFTATGTYLPSHCLTMGLGGRRRHKDRKVNSYASSNLFYLKTRKVC